MPGKRISFAAGLKAQGPTRKTARSGAGGGAGPLVACARRWGSAHWVFEGSAHEAGRAQDKAPIQFFSIQ